MSYSLGGGTPMCVKTLQQRPPGWGGTGSEWTADTRGHAGTEATPSPQTQGHATACMTRLRLSTQADAGADGSLSSAGRDLPHQTQAEQRADPTWAARPTASTAGPACPSPCTPRGKWGGQAHGKGTPAPSSRVLGHLRQTREALGAEVAQREEQAEGQQQVPARAVEGGPG